jgi:DNA-binding winged helix-turn-helix (wHTH) protein
VTYAFGEHELDVDRLELRRASVHVPMEPQTFDVLTYLVRHRERVVPEEELMDEVRGGRFVSEMAVTSGIKQARRPRRRRAVAEVHPDPPRPRLPVRRRRRRGH